MPVAPDILGSIPVYVVASDARPSAYAYAKMLEAAGFPVLVCTGTNDDLGEQAAFNALPTLTGGFKSGRICHTEGNFYFGAPVTFNQCFAEWQGGGSQEGTHIHLANGANSSLFLVTGASRMIFSKAHLDGNKANQGVAAPLIHGQAGVANICLRHMVILSSLGNALQLDEGHEVIIAFCQIEYHDQPALYFTTSAVSSAVILSNLLHSNNVSIQADDVVGLTILGNPVISANAGQHGIVLTGATKRVAIANNPTLAAGAGARSVYMQDTVAGVDIIGNRIFLPIEIAAAGVDYVNIGPNGWDSSCADPRIVTAAGANLHGQVQDGAGTDRRRLIRAQNTSGGALVAGNVVVLKAVATGYEFTTTTTRGDGRVCGMLIEGVADNAWTDVLVLGKTVQLKVNVTGAIVIGDPLCTYTTAGIACKAGPGDTAFAIALEAYAVADSNGVIDALVKSPWA